MKITIERKAESGKPAVTSLFIDGVERSIFGYYESRIFTGTTGEDNLGIFSRSQSVVSLYRDGAYVEVDFGKPFPALDELNLFEVEAEIRRRIDIVKKAFDEKHESVSFEI